MRAKRAVQVMLLRIVVCEGWAGKGVAGPLGLPHQAFCCDVVVCFSTPRGCYILDVAISLPGSLVLTRKCFKAHHGRLGVLPFRVAGMEGS